MSEICKKVNLFAAFFQKSQPFCFIFLKKISKKVDYLVDFRHADFGVLERGLKKVMFKVAPRVGRKTTRPLGPPCGGRRVF